MSLQPGQTLGGFTIVAKIGEGGMGEVYRATDARLGRDVAIKVLPDSVALDPDRRARFEREAKALAALNHFNIAQVYGLEGTAIVMELLEGESLRDRLAGGRLPVRKALDFGAQIARGLAAAHERGIIHRDLKPENVFVVGDGQIKILDFGLARQSADAKDATMTRAGTEPGVVLGTAGYMSPEQVRGQVADARSDVFALGAVLFEMLTGRRAFQKDTGAETMSAVLNEHPPELTTVRAEVPPAIDRIVQHCLEKHPAERFQSTRDVAFALDALSGSGSSQHAAAPLPRKSRERIVWAASTAALAAVALWTALDRAPQPSPGVVTRSRILLPQDVEVTDQIFPGSRLSLSPDATRLVFTGNDRAALTQQLFLLSLESGAIEPVPGTRDSVSAFFSPDGRHLAFGISSGIARVPVAGGTPQLLSGANRRGTALRGGWNGDGVILTGGQQLMRVSANGGPMVPEQAVEGERYAYPQFLPDGRHYLFAAFRTGDPNYSVRVGELDVAGSRELIAGPDVTGFIYASGALLFTRSTTLFAQRFDPATLQLSGEPVMLAADVAAAPQRGAAFAASGELVVYQSSEGSTEVQLTWLDRQGTVLSTVGSPADFENLQLSRDGRRLLASAVDPQTKSRDIYLIDVQRGVRQRFTFDPSDERSAIWSPDQREILYTSKGLDLYRRATDQSSPESPVLVDGKSKDPYDWSPDGRLVLYRRTGDAGTGNDLHLHPIDGGADRPLAATRFHENAGRFSPDGQWIVYVSDESGRDEIYAVRIDGGGKLQVSSDGGNYPRWRGNGREILFLSPDRTMMSAQVLRSDVALDVRAPVPLFRLEVSDSPGPVYDVTADGSRFIVAAPVPSKVPPSLTLLQNWTRLLPAPR